MDGSIFYCIFTVFIYLHDQEIAIYINLNILQIFFFKFFIVMHFQIISNLENIM